MSQFLSILFISEPVLASNNRGESEGTLQSLQKINTVNGTRTVITGGSLRYALRRSLQDQGLKMWRRVVEPTEANPVGMAYGDNNSPTMDKAVPGSPQGFADEIFGWMVATSAKSTKRTSDVCVANAISCSPYAWDKSFRQGHSAVPSAAGKPQLMPFSQEQHWTRYQTLITIDLGKVKGEVLRALLNALKGLQVGGAHSSNLTELIPGMLAWRFHQVRGQSGLYLGAGIDFPPDAPVNLDVLRARADNLGISFFVAGVGMDVSVAMGIETMVKDAAALVSVP